MSWEAYRCWADVQDHCCPYKPTTEIGLCTEHYRGLFGRDPDGHTRGWTLNPGEPVASE